MSTSIPSIRDRVSSFENSFKAPVREISPDLAEESGLRHLAELKRSWDTKENAPSSSEVLRAIKKDLIAKFKFVSSNAAVGPEVRRSQLQNRIIGMLKGTQFDSSRAISRGDLNKIMWKLLEPSELVRVEIIPAIKEALGDRVADALEPHRDALAKLASDDPDPEALLGDLERRDFRVCLELAVSCAEEQGVWNENTMLSDYGLEGKFEQMLGDRMKSMDEETDLPPVVLENKPRLRLFRRTKSLPENSERESFLQFQEKINKIEIKGMSFGKMRDIIEGLDRLDHDLYYNF